MRVTKKTDYAVRALIYLAQRYGQGPIQSADIASRQQVPLPFLDQLMTVLRKANLVISLRGPGGGHALARHPSEITLRDVVEQFEGQGIAAGCPVDQECKQSSVCAQQEVWDHIRTQVDAILASVTIAELAQRQSVCESESMYYI